MRWTFGCSRILLIGIASTSVALALLAVSAPAPALADAPFLRGDVNADGRHSISDALMIRRWLFLGGAIPCMNAADVNDDGLGNLSDAIELLAYLFQLKNLPPPPAPYPDVGPDPTPNADPFLDCRSYQVVEAKETDDLIRIGNATGGPGDRVKIPVHVANSVEVEAIQLVIRYDPEVFIAESGRGPIDAWRGTQGLYFEGSHFDDMNLSGFFFVNQEAYPEQGIITVGFIPHTPEMVSVGRTLPAGGEKLAFLLGGQIAETAAPGTEVELVPTNAGFGPAGLRNELTHRGGAIFASTLPRLEKGVLRIVGDQTFFLRGDANGDLAVDISDAQFALAYIFLGGPAPGCLDAADANDDGRIDISDPIHTLHSLFVSGENLPAPFPSRGGDPTEDLLDCRER